MLAFRPKALDVAVVQGEVHKQQPTDEKEGHKQQPTVEREGTSNNQQSKGWCTTINQKSMWDSIFDIKFTLITWG